MELQNKVALITGASVGIGRATALAMAEKGADLILLDINYEKLVSVKEELSAFASRVLIYACDISDEDCVKRTVSDAQEALGRIDILVNNAALWRDMVAFIDSSTELWRRYMDVNVMGTVYVTHAVLPSMLANGYGRIVNVASVAGIYGNRNMAHYSASKGAVIAFTKSLAKELSDTGVLVNAVSPGSVSPAQQEDVTYTQSSSLSYLGRTGSCRENAELICFLASDKATYITGQNIQIDGCRKKL